MEGLLLNSPCQCVCFPGEAKTTNGLFYNNNAPNLTLLDQPVRSALVHIQHACVHSFSTMVSVLCICLRFARDVV